MNELKNKCVAYSHKQQAFDVLDTNELLETNVRGVIDKHPSDWICLYFVDTDAEGCEFIETLESRIGKRHITIEDADRS